MNGVDFPGVEEYSLGKSGFSRINVSRDSNVSELEWGDFAEGEEGETVAEGEDRFCGF